MGIQKADEVVAQLVIDIKDKQNVLDAVMHLQTSYPDLIVKRDPNLTTSIVSTKFCSDAANKVAEDIDIVIRTEREVVDGTGCIIVYTDIVEAWPFTTIDGYKVHTIDVFTIGHKMSEGFGVVPVDCWEDKMQEAHIALTAIRKARDYIKRNPPITY